MTVYIRRAWSDVWHWMIRCSHYPHSIKGEVVERVMPDRQRPPSGELCDQCIAKERRRREREQGGHS